MEEGSGIGGRTSAIVRSFFTLSHATGVYPGCASLAAQVGRARLAVGEGRFAKRSGVRGLSPRIEDPSSAFPSGRHLLPQGEKGRKLTPSLLASPNSGRADGASPAFRSACAAAPPRNRPSAGI